MQHYAIVELNADFRSENLKAMIKNRDGRCVHRPTAGSCEHGHENCGRAKHQQTLDDSSAFCWYS